MQIIECDFGSIILDFGYSAGFVLTVYPATFRFLRLNFTFEWRYVAFSK